MMARKKTKNHEPTYWPVVEGAQALESSRVARLLVLKAMDMDMDMAAVEVLDMDMEVDVAVAADMAIVSDMAVDTRYSLALCRACGDSNEDCERGEVRCCEICLYYMHAIPRLRCLA